MNFDQITIKAVKLKGNLRLTTNSRRYLRISCGKLVFKSTSVGHLDDMTSLSFLEFNAHIKKQSLQEKLYLQCFQEHVFGKNAEQYQLLLSAELTPEDIKSFRGEFLELSLFNINKEQVGIVILVLEAFQKYKGFWQKVGSEGTMERPKREAKLAAAKNPYKQIMAQDFLSNRLLTISSIVCHLDIDDVEISGNECLILIKYGKLKFYTRALRKYKEELIWTDYMQFAVDEKQKFQFFFICINQVDDVQCKAKGDIKYVVFDETITAHQVPLLDLRRKKYATLHIKFAETEFKQMKGNVTRLDKRIKEVEGRMETSLNQFNRVFFDNKYNAHILSESLREKQLKELQELEKSRPLNAEELKIKEENRKFVEFLQKELIKFDVEQERRDKASRLQKYKNKFLPLVLKNSQNVTASNLDLSQLQPNTSRRYAGNSTDRTEDSILNTGSLLVLPKI